jgi:hypothetical protein
LAQFKTFSGLRTYGVPLQRDLRELERWIRETEGRLAQLTADEPISAPAGGGPKLAAHATTHEFLGSDPVESVNKLQVGAAPSASQAAGTAVVHGNVTLGKSTADTVISLTFDGLSNDGAISYNPSTDTWTFDPEFGRDSFLEWAGL